MPSDHTPTRFTTLMVGGGAIAASVITAALVGSAILKGDLVFDSTDNSTPSVVVDSTTVLDFTTSVVESPKTISGARLVVEKPSQGTGSLVLSGSSGGTICFRNTAGAMKVITVVTSTVTVRDAVAADNCNP